jgi:Cu2+-exporting ATPase
MEYDAPGKCKMDGATLVEAESSHEGMKHEHHEGHSGHKGHDHSDHHRMMMTDFKRRFFVSLVVSMPVLILSPLIQKLFRLSITFPGDKYVLFTLSAFVFLYGGWPFLKGIVTEVGAKRPGMMTLIALAITVAFVYSSAVVFGLKGKFFFWELVTLIDVMLLGHWLEMKSVLGASRALEKLAQLMPAEAHLIKGNDIVTVNISDLKTGDKVLIKAGEKIPSDGIIVKGEGYVDESMLTGESKPVKKGKGAKLIGGAVNGDAIFEIIVEGTGEESYLSKVINLVKEAQESKSKTQRLADKAALWLTIIAITVGTATLVGWLVYGNRDFAFAVERMATVMVITCPHALGLAIPLVTAVSTSLSAKNGLLIRNRTAFENSRKITTIVFDKTGTLTEGSFGVNSIKIFDNKYDEKKLVGLAASLEKSSEHPIAKGILTKTKQLGIKPSEVKNFKVLKGEGVSGSVAAKKVMVVSPGYLKKNNIKLPHEDDAAATTVFVIVNNKLAGSISLSDKVRDESVDAIRQLKDAGIECWMLTGDNEKVAKAVSEKIGLDGYFAEVLPHQKQEKVKELQAKGEYVAMTGDGVNDAPALAQADVGIAVGSGTDIAAETADIILVNSNPKDVTSLILFGKATYRKMVQNLLWATGYNVVAIPLAAGVLYGQGIIISPAIGAALMSLSTVIVAVNAKFLKVSR